MQHDVEILVTEFTMDIKVASKAFVLVEDQKFNTF
tara:strand:- start:815 stop:919 length:105 start_codon:yes stop_codon:yes gene_type:complete